MNGLIIFGASGHGKVVADIAEKKGYDEICFLDIDASIQQCGKYKVYERPDQITRLQDKELFVAIGNAMIRQRIMNDWIKQGYRFATLIHPDAIVADDVEIGEGSVVMAGVVINSNACIGKGCIINTCSSVDHDCIVEDYSHISVGAHLAGTVHVGERSWVGIGAVVSNNLTICSDCMIGAGAVVVKDIVDPGTYVGVPAGKIKD